MDQLGKRIEFAIFALENLNKEANKFYKLLKKVE